MPVVLGICLYYVTKFTKSNIVADNHLHKYAWNFILPLVIQIIALVLLPRFDHRTPLMKVAAKGDIEKVRQMVKAGKFDIYEYTIFEGFNTNAMMEAIKNNRVEIVRLFLQTDKEISRYMKSNLDYAVRSGNSDVVNIFIEGNALELVEDSGASAVSSACYQGGTEIARLLVNAGADDTFIKKHGCITLDEMLTKRESECGCKDGASDEEENCLESK